jgi:hypothetical protein
MKSINCLVYFDLLGDTEQEDKLLRYCWNVWQRKHPHLARDIHWSVVIDIDTMLEQIQFNDFIFFDYGGLGGVGHQSLAGSFARTVEEAIEEHPSKEFILLCTMDKSYYEDDYLGEHPNLHFEDVDWFALFDKFLGGKDVKNIE